MKRMVFALCMALTLAMSTAAATFAAQPARSLLAGGPTAAAPRPPAKGPDLVVPAVVPDTAHPFNYAVTVQNAGTASANVKGVVVRGVYSPDTTVDPSDTPACQRTLSDTNLTLGMGAALTVPVTCSLAPGAGDRYLLVQADATNLIRETDESNNVGSVPLADLTVFAVSNVGTNGDYPYNYIVSVKNVGIGAADLTGVSLRGYYSADTIPDLADHPACLWALNGTLAAGGTIDFGYGCPDGPQSGDNYFLAWADATNRLPESNESNNVGRVGFPDLVVQAVNNLGANGPYPYNYTVFVLNLGPAPANLTDVYVEGYYSADTIPDAADHPGCLSTLNGTLAPGQGMTFVHSCSYGPQPGDNHFLAWVDAANHLMESNESNNIGVGAV